MDQSDAPAIIDELCTSLCSHFPGVNSRAELVTLAPGLRPERRFAPLARGLHHLKRATAEDLEIFADFPNCGLQCTSTLFETLRPDIEIRYKRDLYVIELTVPYETNCKIAR